MQGVGNDFVVMDNRFSSLSEDLSSLAIRVCDRKFGVGADGLLVLDNSDRADFLMRMYNPDGTPDVCGNGLRCIARYAREREIVCNDAMRIETLVDVRRATLRRDAQGELVSVTVEMGQPHFAPSEIPVSVLGSRVTDLPLRLPGEYCLPITSLSTGSTHSVAFVDELPGDEEFFRISPMVENHSIFPERTSLMWCKVEAENVLRLRIWERGAGETLGCGTGACAAAVASILHGDAHKNSPITVMSKGGTLQIVWNESGILMTGPAEWVFEGELLSSLA